MKVSKENLWIGILTVLMMAIMLIPFPATVQKILWILNMAGALGIVVGAIVSIIRKSVPKVFQEGIKYYLMYSMSFTVTSIRYLFWFKTKRDEIPMISKLLETEYQNSTHITLLLFFIFTSNGEKKYIPVFENEIHNSILVPPPFPAASTLRKVLI